MQSFDAWLADLRAKRRRWVDASHENKFDRGIWNATVEKYADPTHFVFELLQNAEDAAATSARFDLSSDRIVFEHDGEPFTRADIEGITGIGNTTKLDQANRIGCFGIGFKSVYVVTSRPEVHGPIEGRPMAFAIDDLVVPTRIPTNHAGTATRIVLPLGPERAEEVISAVGDTLKRCGARSLLFLRGLQQLEWVSPMGKGTCSAQGESQGKRVLVTSAAGAPDRIEHYHVLERDVPHGETGEAHAVKIALRLDDDGKEVVPEEDATRLAVFFETEEPTGLRFRVHGPFQLTDNRANIKRDDPWNTQLVRELGALLSEALPRLRDAGLVTEGLLKALPNPNDSLPGPWAILREAAVSAFKREPLVPARFAGHVAAGNGIRGPAAIRDFLRDEGLAAFGNQPGRKWAASASQRNNRADQFLSALGMPEWGQRELVTAFRDAFDEMIYLFRDAAKRTTAQAWFDGLSDEDVQRFYLLIEAAARDENAMLHFGMMVFVRAEDGTRACPGSVFLPPRETEPGRDANVAGLAMVRASLLGGRRGPDVARFLRHAGVKETGEREYLQTLLAQAYGEDGARPSARVHLEHMRRVLQYLEQTKDVSVVRGLRFLRAEGVEGYFTASQLYLDSPFAPTGLSAVYDGRASGRSRLPLWRGYERLPREKLLALCEALSVESALEVRRTTIPYDHPMRAQLMYNWPRTRVTDTAIDRDYTIDQARALLDLGDRKISKLILDAVSKRGREFLYASYRPNESHQPRWQLSSLALSLREAKWLPARDGTFHRPRELSEADLDPAFAVAGNVSWLAEIGFGADHKRRSAERQERQRAAREMGVPDDLFDLLDGMRLEDRQGLFEKVRLLAEGARFAASPEFPERAAPNPERRAARVAERAAATAAKTYEVRDRSVRTTAADPRRQADVYLRDLYTNRAGEMVCQACHQQMPFRRLDGSPYFEAPEFLKDAATEHPENRLALCPTCAAKWLHARETGPQELRAALATAQRTYIPVRLAGEDVQIRFVEVHWDDLCAVFGEPVETSSATA